MLIIKKSKTILVFIDVLNLKLILSFFVSFCILWMSNFYYRRFCSNVNDLRIRIKFTAAINKSCARSKPTGICLQKQCAADITHFLLRSDPLHSIVLPRSDLRNYANIKSVQHICNDYLLSVSAYTFVNSR